MRDWPMNLRTDAWAFPLIERICIHGVGHPDPDSIAFMDSKLSEKDKKYGFSIHGCDLDENGKPCCFDQEKEDFAVDHGISYKDSM
jgi:hypothetical protein